MGTCCVGGCDGGWISDGVVEVDFFSGEWVIGDEEDGVPVHGKADEDEDVEEFVCFDDAGEDDGLFCEFGDGTDGVGHAAVEDVFCDFPAVRFEDHES